MERQRYIQWTVSDGDAEFPNLGYEVKWTEDRNATRVLAAENSFDRPEAFLLDGGAFPGGGIPSPDISMTLSYALSSGIPLALPIIFQDSVLYRVNSLYRHVIDSYDMGGSIVSIAIDQKTNDVWATNDRGVLYVVPVPWTGEQAKTIPTPTDAKGAIPDGARGRYWLIRENVVELISIVDGELQSVATPTAVDRVLASYVNPNNGSLFFTVESAASGTGYFVMYVAEDGTTFDNTQKILDISRFGDEDIVGVDGTDKIYGYDSAGTLTTEATLGGGETLSSISARKHDAVYLFDDTANEVVKLDDSYAGVWTASAFASSPSGFVQIRADFGPGDDRRRIYCWNYAKSLGIEDLTSTAGDSGEVDWSTVGLSNTESRGVLLGAFPPRHLWISITGIGSAPAIEADASSEDVTSSSGSSI